MNASSIDQPRESDLTPREVAELKAARSLDEGALRTIFLEARTANAFLDVPVPRTLLTRAVELALLGPTSANGLPMRVVFVESPQAKELLRPALAPLNVDKTMAAPVTAIIAADLQFHEHFHRTFPARAETFTAMIGGLEADVRRAFARDNALLQMGYFIIAARALGLDAGPMGGFERPLVDAAFFPDGRFVSLYLINLGYADDIAAFPRLPRFEAEEIARFA